MRTKRLIIITVLVFSMMAVLILNQYCRTLYGDNLYNVLTGRNELNQTDLEFLAVHGPLRIGGELSAPPARYFNYVTGQYEGFTVDFINSLSVELSTPVLFQPMLWDHVFDQLESGAIDACDMSYSEERARRFLLSEPFFSIRGIVIVANSLSDVEDLAQLSGLRIGAMSSDYAVTSLRGLAPNVRFSFYKDLEAAMTALRSGEIDGVTGDEPVILHYARQFGMLDDYRVLSQPVHEADGVMAVNKNNGQLLQILNKGIRNLKNKDTIELIQQKWFATAWPLKKRPEGRLLTISIYAFITTLVFILIVFTLVRRAMQRIIDARTSELAISRDTLATTLNALPYLLMEVDDEFNILEANTMVCRELGLTIEDLKNPDHNPLHKEYNHPSLISQIKESFLKKGSLYRQVELGRRYLAVSTTLIESRVLGDKVLIVLEDITKSKLSERQILQSGKMTAVGQLAAGVSHEIRNPLGLIRNYCYALKAGLADDADKSLQMLGQIDEAVQRASASIDNLLNFSRLAPKQIDYVNLKDLLNSILSLQAKNLSLKKIKSDLHCRPDIVMHTNPESMKHIMVNLIANAIDSMPDGGRLSIRCAGYHDGDVAIIFRDTGCGIAVNDLEHIFNPFFTTKPVHQGTGLGLYVVYNQLQELGGAVEVFSKSGRGTLFRLTFKGVGLKEGKNENPPG